MSMEGGAVTLPAGTTIEASRETTQLGTNGQNVQGMLFTLTLPKGGSTSIFVPYALMGHTDEVARLFAERVAHIHSVLALGS